MDEFIEELEFIEAEDQRQKAKVRHKLKDIVVIVLLAVFANADDWVEIGLFAKIHEAHLRKYIPLENGIPSHDTIQRAMAMISPEVFQQIQIRFDELMDRDEGKKLRKIIAIDGKTMRGNRQGAVQPSHILSAWCKEDGFCLGQKAVSEKSGEIKAIPELLSKIEIRGQVVTIDAMGTQSDIAKKIRKKRADYVLALKKNQGTLYADVRDYLTDPDLRRQIREAGGYQRTIEKAHGRVEIREYHQTGEVGWLPGRSKWDHLRSIGMVRKTLRWADGREETEDRFYISSLRPDIDLFRRAVRGHWSVEVLHWHLDVTFREDANRTIDKNSAQNLNIIRKFCLRVLKLLEMIHPKLSLKKKRFVIAQDVETYLEMVLNV